MIETKLQARAQHQRPLPRAKCEHVAAGVAEHRTRIIREGLVIDVCDQCWTRQDLLKVTVDGKLVAPADETAWTNNRMATVKQIVGYNEGEQ